MQMSSEGEHIERPGAAATEHYTQVTVDKKRREAGIITPCNYDKSLIGQQQQNENAPEVALSRGHKSQMQKVKD